MHLEPALEETEKSLWFSAALGVCGWGELLSHADTFLTISLSFSPRGTVNFCRPTAEFPTGKKMRLSQGVGTPAACAHPPAALFSPWQSQTNERESISIVGFMEVVAEQPPAWQLLQLLHRWIQPNSSNCLPEEFLCVTTEHSAATV